MSLGFYSASCIGLLILVVTACSRKEDYVTSHVKRVEIESNSIPGKIVTNSLADTSYFVSVDSGPRSSCDGGWIEARPVLHDDTPAFEPYVDSIDFTFSKMYRHYHQ